MFYLSISREKSPGKQSLSTYVCQDQAKTGCNTGCDTGYLSYRGPVIVRLVNNSNIPFEVNVGDRIAQLILECIQTPEISKVDSLPETVRVDKGFGSTGIAETPILD